MQVLYGLFGSMPFVGHLLRLAVSGGVCSFAGYQRLATESSYVRSWFGRNNQLIQCIGFVQEAWQSQGSFMRCVNRQKWRP